MNQRGLCWPSAADRFAGCPAVWLVRCSCSVARLTSPQTHQQSEPRGPLEAGHGGMRRTAALPHAQRTGPTGQPCSSAVAWRVRSEPLGSEQRTAAASAGLPVPPGPSGFCLRPPPALVSPEHSSRCSGSGHCFTRSLWRGMPCSSPASSAPTSSFFFLKKWRWCKNGLLSPPPLPWYWSPLLGVSSAGWERRAEPFSHPALTSCPRVPCTVLWGLPSALSINAWREQGVAGFRPVTKGHYGRNHCILKIVSWGLKQQLHEIQTQKSLRLKYLPQDSPSYPSTALAMLFICIHSAI